MFQGNVFQSGISYKKIVDEVVSIIMPFGYQSNLFDPNAFQTAIEAVKQIVKVALVNETVAVQSFLGNTQALARVIDENLGITEALNKLLAISRSIVETEGISEARSRLSNLVKRVSETISITISQLNIGGKIKNIAENIAIIE